MPRYCVTCVRYGYINVEAANEKEALKIADHQWTDAISWSGNWCVDTADEDPTLTAEECVQEKAFYYINE